MENIYKFKLPKDKEVVGFNTKIENGNLLVEVELNEKFEPKDGDFLCSENGDVFIYNGKQGTLYGEISLGAYIGVAADNMIIYAYTQDTWELKEKSRYATEHEKAYFLERLEKELHKRWNAETKQLEDIRWKPEEFEHYWYIDIYGNVVETTFRKCCFSDRGCVTVSNCFRTKEAAQKVANQIKEILKNSKAE